MIPRRLGGGDEAWFDGETSSPTDIIYNMPELVQQPVLSHQKASPELVEG